jgi:hypothetical protein
MPRAGVTFGTCASMADGELLMWQKHLRERATIDLCAVLPEDDLC